MCRIGQNSRCSKTGCEFNKAFNCGHCYGDKVKELKTDKEPIQVKSKRQKIYDKSNGICYLCGDPVAFKDMTIDHVIPKSKGGGNALHNLRAAHFECNIKKGNKILSNNGYN